MRELNLVSEQVKYKVYEEDEQKSYNVLAKNVKNDERADKTVKKNKKDLAKLTMEKHAENLGKIHKAITHKKTVIEDLKEKREDLELKYKEKAEQVNKQKTLVLQQKMQVAEKHKLTETDVNENQQRIDTLKNLRNFRILEKHALKSK